MSKNNNLINKITLTNKVSEPVEEAIRSLRTNIQFCNTDRVVKTICVTSCIPNEGKSTTTINLAISMAEAGKKVLHIDADMRKPRLYKEITSKHNVGLSNFLSGMVELKDAISETNYDNLHLILCGPNPPNPAELLDTERFRLMLTALKDEYDYIVIDTPPLGSMIDAAIVASQTDGTILLIEYNTVDYKKAKMVKEQLEKANARILGVIVNKIPRREYKQNYYYDYDYYYKKNARKGEELQNNAM
jgi:capsular exopolysaccharide synthesis family protein